MTRLVLTLILITSALSVKSQQISGKVTEDKGNELPYASIQIIGTENGAVSNAEGHYNITVLPGRYTLRFQYVGYRTKDTTISIDNKNVNLNMALKPEAVTLPTVLITGDNEDPAYTIMRRTIAKAPYHANQIENFNARVYIKGSGRILKVPILFRNKIKKEMAKEGIDSTVAFTQESVSKLSYKRPGQYKDTVISMRATGDDNNTDPMSFISSSFYDTRVAGAVSPLASNAFSIYKFEYLGYIEEHGAIINKIKVTPKSRGDQVFEGTLYITDQVWSIHSLHLTTYIWGIEFAMKQVYAPVKENVWMPVDQIFDVYGNVFGFGFEYKYLAHVSNYNVTLNPDVNVPVIVLDDKKDKEESKAANEKINTKNPNASIGDLVSGQELSAKQLRKMMKEYKKQELDSMPEVKELTNGSSGFAESKQVIDSNAAKRDTLYWAEVRPIVLTDHELKGYSRFDSLSKVQQKKTAEKQKKDSTTLNINLGNEGAEMYVVRNKKSFKFSDLLTGANYNFNNKNNFFKIFPTLNSLHFNTVEGYHAAFKVGIGNNKQKNTKTLWEVSPEIGYALERKKINYTGILNIKNVNKKDAAPWNLKFSAGNRPYSFNPALERGNALNSMYSLFFRKNYLKLFDKKFVGSEFSISTNNAIFISTALEYQQRDPLENISEKGFYKKTRQYASNLPNTAGISSLQVASNNALVGKITFSWSPFYKFIVTNGYKVKDRSGSPKLTVSYRGSLAGDSKFNYLRGTIRQHVKIGAGDDWDIELGYGDFISKPTFFQDFAHFNGNQYIFSPLDPIKFFRTLPYYQYSTAESHATILTNYQFRKFIFTSIPFLRKKGIRENIIGNALWTQDKGDYIELGYSINYLFRFLRLEAVSTFEDRKYKDVQFRFGLATGFDQLFR